MRTFFLYFARVAAFGLLLGLPAAPARAQSQNIYDWAWIRRLGSTELAGTTGSALPPSTGQPESLAADVAGNVYVAGVYEPNVSFEDPTGPVQVPLISAATITSGYLAKYSASGALLWRRNLTSNNTTGVRTVQIDGAGNAYVLGYYSNQLLIDGAPAASNAGNAYFLTKINPSGTVIWTITIAPDVPTANRFRLDRLAVDATGNSVVQGEFESQVIINGTTFAGTTNKLHCLVLRYNVLGGIIGSFAAYTTGIEQYRTYTGVALLPTGETYLSGYVASAATLQFGSLPLITGPTPAGGLSYSIGFLVKLDNSTTAVWALTTSGASGTGQGIANILVGPQGSCYVLGSFGGGTMTLNGQSLTTATTGNNLFLARIASSGSVESLVGGGGTGRSWGFALGPQGEATIGTGGGFRWGSVQLPGPITNSSSALTGLIQLDATGVPQRGWQTGFAYYTTALAVDGLNRPILAGTAGGAGPYTFGTRQYTSPYAFNTLIARTATTPLATRAAAPVAGLAVYPNPARHAVEVRAAQPGPLQLQLLDMLGRAVRAQTLPIGQTQLDLTGLAPGSYTLRVQQGEARSYRQLVVQP